VTGSAAGALPAGADGAGALAERLGSLGAAALDALERGDLDAMEARLAERDAACEALGPLLARIAADPDAHDPGAVRRIGAHLRDAQQGGEQLGARLRGRCDAVRAGLDELRGRAGALRAYGADEPAPARSLLRSG
jgi:hypothetical protein